MPRVQNLRGSQRAAAIEAWKEVADRFGKLAKVVPVLRRHRAFRNMTRTTVYKWKTDPTSMTLLAIEVLKPESLALIKAASRQRQLFARAKLYLASLEQEKERMLARVAKLEKAIEGQKNVVKILEE